VLLSVAPTPLLPAFLTNDNFDLIDLAPLEVARQLTLIEFDLFRRVAPKELLHQSWSREDKETLAPNIINVISRFNQVTMWVTSLVVGVESAKMRAALVGRLIDIAEKCLELHNINSIVEIMSGLENAAVHRLKQTWELVPQEKIAAFEELKTMISSQSNYKNYRATLKGLHPPCVPYLGVYLTDLTFLDDAQPDVLEGSMINFAKRIKIANVIQEILTIQQHPYNLRLVPEIQDYLCRLDAFAEETSFALSLEREPRDKAKRMSV